MAEFVVKARGDITPRELVRLQHEGYAVYRTAHHGNQYLSNLLLATIGIPLCLYDKTVFSKDLNYHPAYRIVDRQREKLTELTETIVPYGEFIPDSPVRSAGTPARFHYLALRQLFGDLVMTESEFFLKHRTRVYNLLSLVARHRPSQFDRYVFPCGCMAPFVGGTGGKRRARCPHDAKEIDENRLADEAMELMEILQGLMISPATTVRRGGVVCSLAFLQILYTIVCWWESGTAEVFELSGPDFIRYVFNREFMRNMQYSFELINRHAGEFRLPKRLTLYVVPTANFRFGYINGDEKSKLVYNLHQQLVRVQKEKRAQLKLVSGENDAFRRMQELDQQLLDCMRAAQKHSLSWDFFYDIRKGRFFSHHDLLPNRKLVVPDE
ncbi:MAG: hypothetical protein G01um101466_727 [Parcubacteria group bacterium Gr01-1014_66]|nr:MAG: hypothetical protein G01um101466_727 [Parcubacteria group bacterium Gr01-1014_66]